MPSAERIKTQHEDAKGGKGSGKEHGVDAVEDTAMARDQPAAVLPARAAFQPGLEQVPGVSDQSKGKANQCAFHQPATDRGNIKCDTNSRREASHEKACPGLVG